MSGGGPLVVRTALPQELDAAGRCASAAYEADGLADPGYLAILADARSRAQTAEVLVAVDAAGQVVGSVTFVLPGSPWADMAGPGEAEFRMLGVLPQARGRGVARALVEACAARAVEAGARRVVLCSQVPMTPAHRLYRSVGFVRAPERDWVAGDGHPPVALLGFTLDLPGA